MSWSVPGEVDVGAIPERRSSSCAIFWFVVLVLALPE